MTLDQERTAMTVGYLYETKNQVDGTSYIGQSSRLDAESDATNLGRGALLLCAVAEQGAENFKKRILGWFDDQVDLDYAHILAVAKRRADGAALYNRDDGGPRWWDQYKEEIFKQFGALPVNVEAWYQVVATESEYVKSLLAKGLAEDKSVANYNYEVQLRQTQDLTGECPSCGAAAGSVCRTKPGNPAKNHVKRGSAD